MSSGRFDSRDKVIYDTLVQIDLVGIVFHGGKTYMGHEIDDYVPYAADTLPWMDLFL